MDCQGNMWINYARNSHMDGRVITLGAALPTAHLLPGPISVPVHQTNVPGINSATGWMWSGQVSSENDLGRSSMIQFLQGRSEASRQHAWL